MVGNNPVRVGLLLPLGHSSQGTQRLARAMQQAAELALFQQQNEKILLLPKDTRGTADGAAQAAREAIEEGAEIILGPLFSASVSSAAELARYRDIPVVAFSTDRAAAGEGVYLMSLMPEAELEAITQHAVADGKSQFALLIPEGAYGRRIFNTFNTTASRHGAIAVQTEFYERKTDAAIAPAQRLAEQAGTYQAVLIPERGNILRSLAPTLAYYGIDPRRTQFYGTGQWNDPAIQREPSLLGGQFPAPAPEPRAEFVSMYQATYGSRPPNLASLAYDAVALVGQLAVVGPRGNRFNEADFLNTLGFSGVDGIYRFRADGVTERGLAILQVTDSGFETVRPAATSFSDLTF